MSHAPHSDTDLDTLAADPELAEPRLYEVLLHNDDYTTTDFVVDVLERFFRKNSEDAHRLMLEVHHNGLAVCAIYPREIAESKVQQVIDYARAHEYPLLCSMQPH
ncbi:MAG: ATP-dependent Clp protease adapter ClpS [Cardiobacteriaceae bacterium]|nr:ATP-dependent Clp protease adapter ClpS [Cardiobacteriaceae bacterium]